MLKALKKIGLIGGTFDPVHNGHLHLAAQAQDFFDLEKVIFIPAFRSPHKLGIQPESCKHRLAMLALALENRPNFSMNKMEIEKQTVSFTIDTLKVLKSKYSDWELFLILGADAFQAIDTWKQSSQLLDFCNILVGTRPGADFKVSESVQNKLSLTEQVTISPAPKFKKESVILKNTTKGTQVVFFQISPINISSKDIRRRISNKEEIKNLLPPSVDHYIIKNQLYRNESPPKVAWMRENFNALQQLVVDAVSEKKAFDVLILDLRSRSDLTDCFMICSANSKVHVQSIVDAIIDKCHLEKIKPLGVEGYSGGYWVVIDLGDLIGHVFHKQARLHYDLERLWGDVPVIKAIGE